MPSDPIRGQCLKLVANKHCRSCWVSTCSVRGGVKDGVRRSVAGSRDSSALLDAVGGQAIVICSSSCWAAHAGQPRMVPNQAVGEGGTVPGPLPLHASADSPCSLHRSRHLANDCWPPRAVLDTVYVICAKYTWETALSAHPAPIGFLKGPNGKTRRGGQVEKTEARDRPRIDNRKYVYLPA